MYLPTKFFSVLFRFLTIWLVLFCVFAVCGLVGCSDKKSSQSPVRFNFNKEYIELQPKPFMDTLLHHFVAAVGDTDSVYAIHLRRMNPQCFRTRIFAGDYDAYEANKALSKVKVGNVSFDVYSGMELFFDMPDDTCPKPAKFGLHIRNLPETQKSGKENVLSFSEDYDKDDETELLFYMSHFCQFYPRPIGSCIDDFYNCDVGTEYYESGNKY